MTEGNDSVTLHNDSWNEVDSVLRTVARAERNDRLRTIANTIMSQRTEVETLTAVGFCGLPGAGKSYAAGVFADEYGADAISMGDAIRREFTRQECDEDVDCYDGVAVTSEALGDFAAQAREEDPEQIPEWVTEIARESDHTLFAIDGVRSVTDYHVLRRYFENFVLVKVEAPFQTRLERLQERGREGEDEFDREELLERDLHELDKLGFHDLLTYADEWAEEYLPESKDASFNTGAVGWSVTNVGDGFERKLQFVMEESELLPEPKT